MYSSIMVYALSIQTILSLEHVRLLFIVCARLKDTGLVKRVGCMSAVVHLTPLWE